MWSSAKYLANTEGLSGQISERLTTNHIIILNSFKTR